MKNRIDTSRRKTPWDGNTNISVTEKFIQEKYKENYLHKHPKLLDTKEFQIFNNIEIKKCKICNSQNIIKKGFTKNKVQRFYCKDCKKYFNPTTNTIFENHKISITEWI